MKKPVLFKKDNDNWIFIPLSAGADILMMTLDNRELNVVFNDDRFGYEGDDQRIWKKNLKDNKKRKGIKVVYSRLPKEAIGVAMKVKTDSVYCFNCEKKAVGG